MSDYGKDIEGGRLIFIDGDATNRTVEPKVGSLKILNAANLVFFKIINYNITLIYFSGRAIAFTSGEESLHYTERVTEGTRLALTIGFTCNPEHSVIDPKL